MDLKLSVENPEKRALNKLEITTSRDGIKKKVPALSSFWLTPRSHLKYIPLPIKDNKLVSEMGNLDEWLSDMTWFNKELEWMLQLDCHLFWCYLIHDRGCADAIVSFLQESTPAYIRITDVIDNESIISLYTNILTNIVGVVCRLITNKENEYEWLEKDFLAEILYSKYLFSVPIMFDLITTYGRENVTILKRIFQTIMKIEPKYKDDLSAGVEYLLKAFLIIQEKIEIETKLNVLTDVSLHVLDCAYIINVLLDVYPDVETIFNTLKVHQNVAEFYENAVVSLFKKIDKIQPDALGIHHVNKIRVELVGCFRKILNFSIENILKHPNKSFEPSERYLNLMTEVASYPMFLADYNNCYPVEVDIDIIKQTCGRIDNFKINFVMQALSPDEPCDFDEDEEIIKNGNLNHFEIPPEKAGPSTSSSSGAEGTGLRKFENEVESILGVFPNLEHDYARRLLQHYENAELAISAILEGNLPPHLDTNISEPEILSPSTLVIPPDPQDKMFLETGIRRLNVFDGDEFDVMTQENPKCIIKVGKGIPGQAKTITALLDDKTHVRALKERYQEYSIVTENDYDDEYDDSYDAMTESETKAISKLRKAKNIILEEVETVSSSSEEEEETGGQIRNRIDFCENPETIRARYDANRQRKFGARGGGISRDVVGKPKGQGQDDKTVHNRQNKETHKSTRANHNRKGGASFKRNKGMIPS